MEKTLTTRWLTRLGLSTGEIEKLSTNAKARFYGSLRAICEAQGCRKIRANRTRSRMAAFQPREILLKTARCLTNDDGYDNLWMNLFKVQRSWGSLSSLQAQPFIRDYVDAVQVLADELDETGQILRHWSERNERVHLGTRTELGRDVFYESERINCANDILTTIGDGQADWRVTTGMALDAIGKLVDRGLESR